MTDEQIIKALKKCLGSGCYTSECQFFKNACSEHCWQCAIRCAFDLINRQKAEIERLNKVSEICGDCHKQYAEKIERAKSEARKEFAERLKEKVGLPKDRILGIIVYADEIDNLLAEMESERE